MFYKLSKTFLYISLLTPLLMVKSAFFPFISGKAIMFRGAIEISLLFFLFHILANLSTPGFVTALLKKLRHPIAISLIIFAIAITVTALLGAHPTQSFWSNFERGDGAFQILHYVVFALLAMSLCTDKKSVESLIFTSIAVSLPMNIYAIAQLVTPGNANSAVVIAPGVRVSGTLGNPSYLAAYLLFTLIFISYFLFVKRDTIKYFLHLLLGVPAIGGVMLYLGLYSWAPADPVGEAVLNRTFGFAILWYLGAAVVLYLLSTVNEKIFQKVTLYALFIFNFFVLLKTGTRGAFLAIIAGILVIAAVNFFINKNKKVRLNLSLVFVGVIALSAIFFATHEATVWTKVPVLNRLVNFTSATTDIKPRLWTWGSGLAATMERPLLGWGVEGFGTPFDKYYNPNHYGIESFFDRTHNIFLEYAVSGGLLVLLPWLAIFYFYYRALRRRPKDVWYSILFAAPIMYLFQGFFLFDTLPIYLAFFTFLVFFINTEESAVHITPHETSRLRGINIATAGILVVGFAMLMQQTLILPIQKNALLVHALLVQNTLTANAGNPQAGTPAQVVNAFHAALNNPSPIGQEETIGSYQKFALSLLENASQNQEMANNPQVRREVRALVDDVNKWFDNNTDLFPGLKETYINGGLNLRAGISFGQADLLARGKKQFNDALIDAPTRLELIGVLIQLAKIEGDMQTLEKWGQKAELYRPDLFKLEELKKSMTR